MSINPTKLYQVSEDDRETHRVINRICSRHQDRMQQRRVRAFLLRAALNWPYKRIAAELGLRSAHSRSQAARLASQGRQILEGEKMAGEDVDTPWLRALEAEFRPS